MKKSINQMKLVILAVCVAGALQPLNAQESEFNSRQEAVQPDDLRQQALMLKQNLLTATEDEREVIAQEFEHIVTSFDRRITRVQSDLQQYGDELLPNARQYADSLLEVLEREREDLLVGIDRVSQKTGQEWDQAVEQLASSYDAFYETWDDVEAQFGNIAP
ncbi:MAG: hypothetical protein O2948_05760 [Proteobacteria bacterium]|nr:hypothetical protein [Pseudomonadota bacterium]MDA0928398.1 hypothetical protein [Pseudomonadota bacterium]